MEENTSVWNKRQEDLTVSDQLKVAVVAPVIVMGAYLVPLALIGKISEIRSNRKLKKQAKLTIVKNTDEES